MPEERLTAKSIGWKRPVKVKGCSQGIIDKLIHHTTIESLVNDLSMNRLRPKALVYCLQHPCRDSLVGGKLANDVRMEICGDVLSKPNYLINPTIWSSCPPWYLSSVS